MVQLEEFIFILDRWGVTDVALPFMLVFVVAFAIMQKVKPFGADGKKFNLGLAVILGLLFVIPHITGKYRTGADPVVIVNESLPQFSIIFIAIIFFLLMAGVLGADNTFLGQLLGKGGIKSAVIVISALVVLLIFGSAAGWWPEGFSNWVQYTLENLFGTSAIYVVVTVLVFGWVIYIFQKGDAPPR